MIRDHDALVVGAGGAGLWAALELAIARRATPGQPNR